MNRKPSLPIVILILILVPIVGIMFVFLVEGRPALGTPLTTLFERFPNVVSPLLFVIHVLIIALVIAGIRFLVLLPLRGTTHQCPRCGGELHRIHRTPADKLFSRIVDVHRYRCTNPRCDWQGLRRRHHRARHAHATQPPAAG